MEKTYIKKAKFKINVIASQQGESRGTRSPIRDDAAISYYSRVCFAMDA